MRVAGQASRVTSTVTSSATLGRAVVDALERRDVGVVTAAATTTCRSPTGAPAGRIARHASHRPSTPPRRGSRPPTVCPGSAVGSGCRYPETYRAGSPAARSSATVTCAMSWHTPGPDPRPPGRWSAPRWRRACTRPAPGPAPRSPRPPRPGPRRAPRPGPWRRRPGVTVVSGVVSRNSSSAAASPPAPAAPAQGSAGGWSPSAWPVSTVALGPHREARRAAPDVERR